MRSDADGGTSRHEVVRWRTVRRLLALAGVALSVAAAAGYSVHDARDGTRASALLAALVDRPPIPLRVSPDGRLVLEKVVLADGFALRVAERSSGRELLSLPSDDLHLAASWSADGRQLAYLADVGGDQQARPWIVDLSTRALTRLEAPSTAAYRLAWHPIRPSFAYLVCGIRAPDGCTIRHVDTRQPASQHDLASRVDPRAFIAWSPDGSSIATVAGGAPGILLVANLAGEARRVLVEPGALIRELAWSADGRSVLASVRGPRQRYFEIRRVALDAPGRARAIATVSADLSAPVVVGGGTLFHATRRGGSRVMVIDADGAPVRELSAGFERASAIGVSRGGDTVHLVRDGIDGPPALYAVAVRSGSATRVGARTGDDGRHRGADAVRPALIRIRADDGITAPAFMWRARRTSAGAVIMVHGGPNLQAVPAWDPLVQQLVHEGQHVLQLNFRGSTGYTREFERLDVSRGQDVHDVLAACAYAVGVLGVSPARVTVVGTSYGAALAIRAGWRDPSAMGLIVAVSLGDTLPTPVAAPRIVPPLLVYLGANDAFRTPESWRAGLAAVYGARPLADGSVRVTVVPGEGHNFRRQRTIAEIHSQLTRAERRHFAVGP